MALPGVRVLVPSSVIDFQNMLYSSFHDPNPVLFFEHKKLYRSIKEVTPDECKLVDLESARVVAEGADATIITFGMGVQWAIEAADEQSNKGVHIEIIDLRSLAPIDWETIVTSVQKTNRVLLLEEASEVLGPMSEIAAGISERLFQHLDAPVIRCSSIHTPIPFSKELEKGYMANFRLNEKLERLLSY
jgi:2-oxoisovalerate dehydrogenase E1 component